MKRWWAGRDRATPSGDVSPRRGARPRRRLARATILGLAVIALGAVTGMLASGTRGASAAGPVSLSIWTRYPEIEPFYKKAAAEYAKTHPGFTLETLSSQLREMEQKLTAATCPRSPASRRPCSCGRPG